MKMIRLRTMIQEKMQAVAKMERITGGGGQAVLPVCLFAFLLFLNAVHLLHINDGIQLSGVSSTASMPAFTVSGAVDGSYQRDWESWMNDNFFAHAISIKTCNQILYSAFHDGTGDLCIGAEYCVMGKNDSMYIAAPDIAVPPQEEFDEYARSVYELQEKLEQCGKGFAYLFAPMKVDVYPDMIPWNYRLIARTHVISGPTNRERMISAFEKFGVNYYDLTDDMIRMRENEEFEIFPMTGYHWTLTAVASELNSLFQKLSTMTPGIDYPEVDVVGVTDDLYGVDIDIYQLLNIFKGVKSKEYTSPIINYPQPSSNKVYLIGTSMSNEIFDALTDDSAGMAFEQLIYQGYCTHQIIKNSEGETYLPFQETDPPEALKILEHIRESDLILMEQPDFGVGLHNKFLTYANEHIEKLFYRLGDNIVTDYEGAEGVSLSGDYGLEEGTWRWVEKDCRISVCGDAMKNVGRDISMNMSLASYHVNQTIRVTVNGEETAVCQITPNLSEIKVVIPASIIESEVNIIELTMLGEPNSPKFLGESEDARYLGFALSSIVLEVSD